MIIKVVSGNHSSLSIFSNDTKNQEVLHLKSLESILIIYWTTCFIIIICGFEIETRKHNGFSIFFKLGFPIYHKENLGILIQNERELIFNKRIIYDNCRYLNFNMKYIIYVGIMCEVKHSTKCRQLYSYTFVFLETLGIILSHIFSSVPPITCWISSFSSEIVVSWMAYTKNFTKLHGMKSHGIRSYNLVAIEWNYIVRVSLM